MRIFAIFVFLGWHFLGISASGAESPIAIEVSKDYGKTSGVRIDGKSVPGGKVIDELSNIKLSRGGTSVVVLLPSSVRFEDWSNIQGIVEKVGFLGARYFALSQDGEKMVEVKRVGAAVPFSPTP